MTSCLLLPSIHHHSINQPINQPPGIIPNQMSELHKGLPYRSMVLVAIIGIIMGVFSIHGSPAGQSDGWDVWGVGGETN